MSATRNPYYQLLGGADLPGDVRVSDTADSSKTAADGWAASPAAVASMVSTINCSSNVKVANSGDILTDLNATITGKVAQLYFRIKCTTSRSEETIVTGLPKHNSSYIAVPCFNFGGLVIGIAWLYEDGHIQTPRGFDKDGYFQATYITTD
uniref:Uncharacterized protein n=1 Tax=Ackermannviridae sp. TaxID=2831612 RepID=A0A8S5RV82_9CAUD|nr:MAG TPA: hypothetical protein [Ackermannviridae sp.]